LAAVLGKVFPEVCRSGMVTDGTIISERGRWQEEAGMIPGVAAKMIGGGWWRSEDNILIFFLIMDKFRFWQDFRYP
jgi:hypothetical protein